MKDDKWTINVQNTDSKNLTKLLNINSTRRNHFLLLITAIITARDLLDFKTILGSISNEVENANELAFAMIMLMNAHEDFNIPCMRVQIPIK